MTRRGELRELLERYKGQQVKLIKSDGFLITGEILEIAQGAIIFKSRGKELFITFDRIREIRPIQEGRYG